MSHQGYNLPNHAESYADNRSIFCGVTWGVLGLQFVKYLARGSKSQSAYSSMLAVYLMVASTAYLAM